jgi:hypothetical protein
MGSSDPLSAGFEIWFGSLNFQATGNGYLMRITNRAELHPWRSIGPVKGRYGEQERGSEWEPIKILLEGDANSNKRNTACNTHLRLTTQTGQDHVAIGVPLDLGTNTQPSDLRTQRNTKPQVH